MKICILSQWMNTYGGLQKVVTNIANSLSHSNYRITLCVFDDRKVYYEVNDGVQVDYKPEFSYTKRKIFNKIKGYLINRGYLSSINNKQKEDIYFPKDRIEKLERYLAANKFDVVIGVAGEISILLGLTNYKCKKIGWQHNEYSAYFRTKGKYNYALESVAKKSYMNLDAIVVLTESMKNDYRKYMGVDTTIIHNPLSFSCCKVSNQENNQLLFVGRLMKINKGLDFLVSILKYLMTTNSNWSCVVIGDGPDSNYLKREIKNNNLCNRVNFVGTTDEMSKYYLESSILLNTSRWEGFGLTITEAMECGVVPISFNHDGAKEIITHETDGIIVNSYDIDEYVNMLNKLIVNKDWRKQLAIKAKERAKDFEIDKIIGEWNKIIFK